MDELSDVPGSRFWNGFATLLFSVFGLPPWVTSPSARFCRESALYALVTGASCVRDPTYDASIRTCPGSCFWIPKEKLYT